MTNERKSELFNKAIDWVWEHTEGYGVSEYLNALKHIGYTQEEILEEIVNNNFDDDYNEEEF